VDPAAQPEPGACPSCGEDTTYFDGVAGFACYGCAHEWPVAAGESAGPADEPDDDEAAPQVVRDANGNQLADGDAAILVRDLKVKGGSDLKKGSKVKGVRIRLDVIDGHDLDGRIDGTQYMLKGSVLKKA
jgi:protein PhnA